MKKALESLQLVGPPQSLLFSARLKNRSPMRPYPLTERSEFQFPTETPNSPTDPIFLCSRCLFRTHATRAEHSLHTRRCRPRTAGPPPTHYSLPPPQPPTTKAARMSGAALCAALTELGFDGEDPLDADALEWPFQYEEARPLLAWICSCLRPSNVLSPSHLAQ